MADITVVGGATAASNFAGTTTVSYSPTAGNTVILGCIEVLSAGDTVSTVKDSAGNSATKDNHLAVNDGSNNGHFDFFRQQSVPSGITGYTVTWSSTSNLNALSVIELTNVNSSPVDVLGSGGSTPSGTSISDTVTPTAGLSEIILGLAWGEQSMSAGTGFTISGQGNNGTSWGAFVYKIVTSTTGSYTPSVTSATGPLKILGTSYKATAGGVVIPTYGTRMMLCGVGS